MNNSCKHKFENSESRRIPAYGSYHENMPLNPDGTIKYIVLRCSNCGLEKYEEVEGSWTPNTFLKQDK